MPWIETCIAICLIIAFLSLVCSAIQELIAKCLRSRGRLLVEGIHNLLITPHATPGLCVRVLQNPLITSLARNGDVIGKPPSSIEGVVFADALLNELGRGATRVATTLGEIRNHVAALPSGDPARAMLEGILDATERAGGDARSFRDRIVTHYDQVMVRVGGWYRRRVAGFLAGIALVVAFAANADVFHMTRVLWGNHAMREALNRAAVNVVNPDGTTASTLGRATGPSPANTVPSLSEANAALARLPMPLGWQGARIPEDTVEWAWKVLGILVTAAAMSLGAPFWFDVLRMLVSVRSTGAERSAEPKA